MEQSSLAAVLAAKSLRSVGAVADKPFLQTLSVLPGGRLVAQRLQQRDEESVAWPRR